MDHNHLAFFPPRSVLSLSTRHTSTLRQIATPWFTRHRHPRPPYLQHAEPRTCCHRQSRNSCGWRTTTCCGTSASRTCSRHESVSAHRAGAHTPFQMNSWGYPVGRSTCGRRVTQHPASCHPRTHTHVNTHNKTQRANNTCGSNGST
jgi:hypothetical protein